MSTVSSSSPASLGLNDTPAVAERSTHPRLRFDGSWGLAALVLAALIAARVVRADQMISSWTDDPLFLGWLALWLVVLGVAVFAAPARHLARRALTALRGWAQALGEARADAAHRDPSLMQARQRDLDAEQQGRRPWGRYPERLSEGREQQVHLSHA